MFGVANFYAFAHGPEALCFMVVRPSVCMRVRLGGGILRLACSRLIVGIMWTEHYLYSQNGMTFIISLENYKQLISVHYRLSCL